MADIADRNNTMNEVGKQTLVYMGKSPGVDVSLRAHDLARRLGRLPGGGGGDLTRSESHPGAVRLNGLLMSFNASLV